MTLHEKLKSQVIENEYGHGFGVVPTVECPKCGEHLTGFELYQNDDICPCCSSNLKNWEWK